MKRDCCGHSQSLKSIFQLTSRRVRVGLGLGLFRCEETYCSLSDCDWSKWMLSRRKPNSVALPFTLLYLVLLRREPIYVLWALAFSVLEDYARSCF